MVLWTGAARRHPAVPPFHQGKEFFRGVRLGKVNSGFQLFHLCRGDDLQCRRQPVEHKNILLLQREGGYDLFHRGLVDIAEFKSFWGR